MLLAAQRMLLFHMKRQKISLFLTNLLEGFFLFMDFKIKPEEFFLILKLNLKDSFESYDCIYQYVKEKKRGNVMI